MATSEEDPGHRQMHQLWGLRLAHEAALVEDVHEVLKEARAAVSQSRQNATGPTTSDEDAGIHVGDVHHTINHVPGTNVPLPPAPPRPALSPIWAPVGAAMLAAVLAYGAGRLTQPAQVTPGLTPPGSPSTPAVKDVDLIVKWSVGPDGKWQTVVEPVKE